MNPTAEHQRNATFQNPMGGNPKNMERALEPSAVGLIGRAPQQPQQQHPQYGMMMNQVPMMPMQQMPMMPMPMQQQQLMPQQMPMQMPMQILIQMPMQQQQMPMQQQQQPQQQMPTQQMPMQYGSSVMQMPMCMPTGNVYQNNMQGKFM